ncbi:MAG: winged helix-turn-helix transcriptional regulator [Candidatus Korarchaeum sp.]|nr:winged helix-turn-helix transcriptional regulator [Candidatus Korarchaeum sp.]MDW8035202.1 winged helix-turn-helix transcriptional regulator [Candidatus Korarchaeum sp.]
MRLLLALLMLLTVPLVEVSSAPLVEASVVIFPDGWAEVSLLVSGIETTRYELRIQGEPYNLIVSSNGLLLNYTMKGSSLYIDTLSLGEVEVNYQTPSLTSKHGIIWNASLSLPSQSTHVLIPSDATIIGISTIPEEIRSEGDWMRLKFQTGNLWLSYKFESVVLQPRPTPATSTREVSEETNSTPTERGEAKDSGNQSVKAQESSESTPFLTYLIPIIFIAPALLLLSRKVSSKGVVRDDDVEGSIIKELRARGGEVTQAELTKALNLPRATVWRKLRKLESEGIIALERRGNATLVRLRR